MSSEVKFISHTKFPQKVLLWLTISGKGMSKPLFFRSGLAGNREIYSTKCLPEVASQYHKWKKYHKGEDAVFWQDLASAHCSKRSLEEMERLNIDVAPKSANPPNVPQLRPIVNFWANLKRKIYSNNIVAKTEKKLMNKTKKELKNMPTHLFSSAMANVPVNCRKAARKGVEFFLQVSLNNYRPWEIYQKQLSVLAFFIIIIIRSYGFLLKSSGNIPYVQGVSQKSINSGSLTWFPGSSTS